LLDGFGAGNKCGAFKFGRLSSNNYMFVYRAATFLSSWSPEKSLLCFYFRYPHQLDKNLMDCILIKISNLSRLETPQFFLALQMNVFLVQIKHLGDGKESHVPAA
jgi:hypothetical protein